MARLDRARAHIEDALGRGVSEAVIAARYMTSIQEVQKALRRWGVLEPPKPRPTLEQVRALQAAKAEADRLIEALRAELAAERAKAQENKIPARRDLQAGPAPGAHQVVKHKIPGRHPSTKFRTMRPILAPKPPKVGYRNTAGLRAKPEDYAERNAKILKMKRDNPTWSATAIAERLDLGSRQIVIGVLHRAGITADKGSTRGGLETRIKTSIYHAKQRMKKTRPEPISEMGDAPSQEPVPEGTRPPMSREYAGYMHIPNSNAAKHAPTLRMTLEPMSDHAGELLEDTTECVWPFDDRSPWPRRDWRDCDYLRCNHRRERYKNERGELVILPYCPSHWDRAHGTGRPVERRRRRQRL